MTYHQQLQSFNSAAYDLLSKAPQEQRGALIAIAHRLDDLVDQNAPRIPIAEAFPQITSREAAE
jgi:hypothetical protein